MKFFTKPPLGTPLNPAHPLNRGLIGYWPFAEGAGGKTMDLSGKGNHGTLTNMVQGPTSGWTGGKFGGAMRFDGVNDYVGAGVVAALAGAVTATLSIWMFKSVAATNVRHGQYLNPYRFAVSWETNGKCYIQAENGSNSYPNFTQEQTGWHHLVFSYNGALSGLSRLTVLWDGNLQTLTAGGASPAASLASAANQPEFRFGMDNSGGNRFGVGSVSEARLYNRALTIDEAKQLYTDPFCMYEQKSIFRWFMPGGVVARAGSFFFGR